jgi:hypothetical protein
VPQFGAFMSNDWAKLEKNAFVAVPIAIGMVDAQNKLQKAIKKQNAFVAELVDALVSNTSNFTVVSVRVRPEVQNQSERGERERPLETLIFLLHSLSHPHKNLNYV